MIEMNSIRDENIEGLTIWIEERNKESVRRTHTRVPGSSRGDPLHRGLGANYASARGASFTQPTIVLRLGGLGNCGRYTRLIVCLCKQIDFTQSENDRRFRCQITLTQSLNPVFMFELCSRNGNLFQNTETSTKRPSIVTSHNKPWAATKNHTSLQFHSEQNNQTCVPHLGTSLISLEIYLKCFPLCIDVGHRSTRCIQIHTIFCIKLTRIAS